MDGKYLIGWCGKLQYGRTLHSPQSLISSCDLSSDCFFIIPCYANVPDYSFVTQIINVGNLPRLYLRLPCNKSIARNCLITSRTTGI